MQEILVGKQAAAAAKHEPAAAAKKALVSQWTVHNVCEGFTAQKLGEYTAAIEENGVDGRLLQKTAGQQALIDLGITNSFHVIKIEDGLAKTAQNLVDGSVAEALVSCASLLCARNASLMLCRAAHVRLVRVQARVQPHVVPRGA
jgi:hypothetical protein